MRQAGHAALEPGLLVGQRLHPDGLVKILRHVDIDLDEDEPLDRVGTGTLGEIGDRPVSPQLGRALGPGVTEALRVEQVNVCIDDWEVDHDCSGQVVMKHSSAP